MDRLERLARRIVDELDGGPVESQTVLAKRLEMGASDVARALKLLERRGVVVRDTTPGSVAKSIRLVEPRNNLLRKLRDERHFTVSEVAALVDSGELVVTHHYVIYRRRSV